MVIFIVHLFLLLKINSLGLTARLVNNFCNRNLIYYPKVYINNSAEVKAIYDLLEIDDELVANIDLEDIDE